MIQITNKSTLEDILRKEKVLTKYMVNAKKVIESMQIKKYLKARGVFSLYISFGWENSNEGHNFWKRIVTKYEYQYI
jgi:hypothetical protein